MKRWLCIIVLCCLSVSCSSSAERRQPSFFANMPSGHLSLHFDGSVNQALQHKITSVIMPYVDKQAGVAWQNIDVYLSIDLTLHDALYSATFCGVDSASASIRLPSADRYDTIAHELSHAHHGCAVLTDARLEEGIATAIGFQYGIDHRLELPQPLSQPNPDVDSYDPPVYNRPGIGGGLDLNHNPDNSTSNPGELASIRERLAGTAFLDFWHAHTDFLKRLNNALYAKLHQTSRVEDKPFPQLTMPANWAEMVAETIEPDFLTVLSSNHVFDSRPTGNQILILGRNHSLEILIIGRDQAGNERALEGLDFLVTVSLGDAVVQQTMLNSGPHNGSYTGRVIVPLQLPSGAKDQAITVVVKGGSLRDDLTYIPRP